MSDFVTLLAEGLIVTLLLTGPITLGIYELTGGVSKGDNGRILAIEYVFGVVLSAVARAYFKKPDTS